MHHLCPRSRRHPSLSRGFTACQALVRFFALHRIKPHSPPLVRAPINSFEFHSCERTPQVGYLTQLADAYSSDTVIASSPRKEVHDPWAFYLHAALLRQAFAHCGKFPTAASRRSLGRVSVPVWLIIFSDQLLIIALAIGDHPRKYKGSSGMIGKIILYDIVLDDIHIVLDDPV
ncbi:hypothetical protein IEQ34_017403 [Dendrobium chrysotoxum]|uniref:Uncharacterized protein n=1 Tax=Dendrobium chrysotoxum TaxID=161865 RepID=A0AAV7GBF6_DENCH|nr:hypothetical protein IEQ34_017403 [Dendrobium chrysotoxum]